MKLNKYLRQKVNQIRRGTDFLGGDSKVKETAYPAFDELTMGCQKAIYAL